MIFRPSQKLNAKIKAGILNTLPPLENPYADWSANLFTANRRQYILLTNTKSLYSTVMYGKGITHHGQFIDRALSTLREFMQDDGQQFAYRRFIAPATASACFATALNRSVTGSMNDFISHATMWLTEGQLSPHEVGFKLNNTPCSPLATATTKSYATPQAVFKTMLPGA